MERVSSYIRSVGLQASHSMLCLHLNFLTGIKDKRYQPSYVPGSSMTEIKIQFGSCLLLHYAVTFETVKTPKHQINKLEYHLLKTNF